MLLVQYGSQCFIKFSEIAFNQKELKRDVLFLYIWKVPTVEDFYLFLLLFKKKKLLLCVLWGPNMEEISGNRRLEKIDKLRLQK